MNNRTLEQLFHVFVAMGDEAALDELFRRAAPPLRILAERLGQRGQDADDLVQDSLVTAVELADRFEQERRFLPWVKGILARKAARLARTRLRRRTLPHGEGFGDLCTAGSPEEEARYAELRRAVFRAISAMPEHYREPLRLFLLHGADPLEVAALLGRPRATIRVQLHRGLTLLRRSLPASLGVVALITMAESRLRAEASPPPATERAAERAMERATERLWMSGRAVPAILGTAVILALAVILGLSLTAPAAVQVHPPLAEHPVPVPESTRSSPPRLQSEGQRVLISARPASAPEGIQIHVRDSTDHPLQGVGFRLEPATGRDPDLYRYRALSDLEGKARFAHPGLGSWILYCDRLAQGRRIELETSAGLELQIQVPMGSRIEGIVVDPVGNPIAEAEVWLGEGLDPRRPGMIVSRSDAGGRFVLSALRKNTPIAVRHRAWGPSLIQLSPDTSGGDPVEPMVFRLVERGAVLSGLVLGHSGRPLVHACVQVGLPLYAQPFVLAQGKVPGRPPVTELRSDASGRFRTSGLGPGRHPVWIRARGYRPLRAFVSVGVGGSEEVREVQRVFELEPGQDLRVRVLDESRKPIAGALVVFRAPGTHGQVDILSDAEGWVRFDALPAGAGVLAARALGKRPETREWRLQGVGIQETSLILKGREGLSGRVLLTTGRPAPSYEIRAKGSLRDSLEVGRARARSDELGRFSLDLASLSGLRLWVRGPGEPLWLRIGWNLDPDGELVLRLSEKHRAASWIQGRTLDEQGKPLADQRLFLSKNDGIFWELGRSGPLGQFRLGPLPAGSYEMFCESKHVERPSFLMGRIQLAADRTGQIDGRAPPCGTITWDLVFEDGGSPSDVVLTLVGMIRPGLTGMESRPRRFALHHRSSGRQVLPSGKYELNVMGSNFRWIQGRSFEVRPGETTRLSLSLEPAARRKIRIRGLPRGEGRAKASLFRVSDGELLATVTLWLDHPRTVTVFLGPGRYELRIDDPGLGRWRAPISFETKEPKAKATTGLFLPY